MAHHHDHHESRCDILDVLEAAVTTRGSVDVSATGGQQFVDRVRDVVTQDGEDFAEFENHGRVAVSDIREAVPVPRSEQPTPSLR